MGFFRKREARTASLSQLQAIIDRSGLTQAGVFVDPDTALRHSAVWACQELIAGVGSSLPLDEYRVQSGQAVEVPLSSLFADPDPDPSTTANAWRAQVLRSAVARGNAYATLLGAEDGFPDGAVTIHPDRVQWRWEKFGPGYRWEVYVDGKRRERWPLGDLWHFPLFQQPGSPVGLNPVEYHRQSIGAALAAQKFGGQFFDAGGNPSVIVKVPAEPTPEEAKALKQRILEATRGNREPLVLPVGLELEKVTIPPEDSQFLETQRFGVEEIARIFLGGFPELIGASVTGGGSITYANREQRMADFIALSLGPRYLVPLEAALSALTPRGRYVKHNMDALLRSDLKGRYESYKLAAEVADKMGQPLLTINEMRELENRPRIEGGDSFVRQPSQAAPVQRDERMEVLVSAMAERAAHPAVQAERSDTHIHLPESLAVEMRQDDELRNAMRVLAERAITAEDLSAWAASLPVPQVTVEAPNVTVEAPQVTVEAPQVTVEAAAVTVPVTVNVPEEERTTKTVRKNADGSYTVTES